MRSYTHNLQCIADDGKWLKSAEFEYECTDPVNGKGWVHFDVERLEMTHWSLVRDTPGGFIRRRDSVHFMPTKGHLACAEKRLVEVLERGVAMNDGTKFHRQELS